MKKRTFLFFLVFLNAVASFVMAQEMIVTGTVYDGTGNVLPGVNILVKGTQRGASADFDGKFQIRASSGEFLIFSYLGFTTKEIEVTGNQLNVTLEEDTNELDEVVVTAFGVEKKEKSLGYSVTKVNTEDVILAGQVSAVEALQGRVAGVQINRASGSAGGGVDILVRGISSINPGRNNQPLIIVDGLAINNDNISGNILPSSGSNAPSSSEQFAFSSRSGDINPEDIENYSVLKGAAATALYGVRAANGAIVITTKKGRFGKARINVTMNTTFRKVTKVPELQTTYREGYLGSPRVLYTPETETGYTLTGTSTPFYSFGPEYSVDSFQYDEDTVLDLSNDKFHDIYDDLFSTGINTQINFNISGADDRFDYFFSVGNSSDQSIVPNSDYGKLSFRFKGGYKVTDNFKISSSIQYTNSGGRRANGGDKSIISSLAYYSPTFDLNDYKNADGTQRNYTPWIDNPRYFAEVSALTDDVNRWIGNVTLNWSPLDWLNLSYQAQIDNYSDHRNRFVPPELDTGSQVGGFIINENVLFTGIESNFLATMTKSWSEDFITSLSLGNQISDVKSNYDRMYGENLNIAHYNDISNATILDNSNSVTQVRNVGVFGELKLEYMDKVFVTFTGRNDWVSTLPQEDRSFFYPSISGAYLFSEDIVSDNDIFSFGKLRASWAEVGKGPGFGDSGHYFVADGDFPFNGVGGFRSSTSTGLNLVPERTRTWEVGTDLRFFKNRLRFDYSYFTSKVNNQIFDVNMAYSTGLSSVTRNAGNYKNWGHELLISGDVVKTEDLNVELIYNFSTNRGEVLDLPDDVENVTFAGDGAPELYLRVKEGDKMGSLYGYNWTYVDGELFINSAGYPEIDDSEGYVIVGNALPDFTMSLGSNIKWKNLGLNFLVEWKKGGDKYSWARRTMIRNGTSKVTEYRNIDDYVFEGVMEDPDAPGTYVTNTTPTAYGLDESYYRSWTYFTGAAENYLQDASWVKLRSVGLSYDLRELFGKKNLFDNLVLSVSANNILLWTPYDGYDPEGSAYSAGSNIYGFSGKGIPLTENYSMGLKIGF